MAPIPGRNARCPCGSGKKFKHCCAIRAEGSTRGLGSKRAQVFTAALKWSGILVGALVIVLLVRFPGAPDPTQSSKPDTAKTGETIQSTYVTSTELEGVINFGTTLDTHPRDVEIAISKFNRMVCDCGCPYTMAKCILADKHCPHFALIVAEIQKEIDGLGASPNTKTIDSIPP